MGKPSKSQLSLVQFAREKRRATCPVCKLPADVLAQLIEARNKKITRAVQLEWLRTEVGVTITDDQLNVHGQGRHDTETI